MYLLIACLVSHKLLPPDDYRNTRKRGITEGNWISANEIRDVRYFDGRVCTRCIPNDKSSADGTFDGKLHMLRTQTADAIYRAIEKKAKPHEESQGQPVAITCSSLQPRP